MTPKPSELMPVASRVRVTDKPSPLRLIARIVHSAAAGRR